MSTLNLYRITRGSLAEPAGWDEYRGAVVAAPNEGTAQRMHPEDGSVEGHPDMRSHEFNAWGERWNHFDDSVEESIHCSSSWVAPNEVHVELLGEAAPNIEAGLILSDFKAG
jgi:hypothetical protein